MLVINTESSSAFFEQFTQLDGIEYLLRFKWSDREGCWYLGIYSQNGDPIAVGVRLVVSWPLLRRFRDPRTPPGILVCVDTSERGQDIIAATDLGSRVLLMYVPADELNVPA